MPNPLNQTAQANDSPHGGAGGEAPATALLSSRKQDGFQKSHFWLAIRCAGQGNAAARPTQASKTPTTHILPWFLATWFLVPSLSHAAINASQTLILQTGGIERARINTLGFETNRVSTTYISATYIQIPNPTANNQPATKAYVDAAVAAGGCSSRPTYLGISSASSKGGLGGILALNSLCTATYPNSRAMQVSDIIKADYSTTSLTTEAWINCDIMGGSNCYGGGGGETNCTGWTSAVSTQRGATVKTSGAMGNKFCDTSYPVHCVKD